MNGNHISFNSSNEMEYGFFVGVVNMWQPATSLYFVFRRLCPIDLARM